MLSSASPWHVEDSILHCHAWQVVPALLAKVGLHGNVVAHIGRYFLHCWPKLCFMAFDGAHCFGTVVCKMDIHGELLRGYIAMLVVEHAYRGLGVGAVPA